MDHTVEVFLSLTLANSTVFEDESEIVTYLNIFLSLTQTRFLIEFVETAFRANPTGSAVIFIMMIICRYYHKKEFCSFFPILFKKIKASTL